MFTITLRNLCLRTLRGMCARYKAGTYDSLDSFLIDYSLGLFDDGSDAVYCLIKLDVSPAFIEHFIDVNRVTIGFPGDPNSYNNIWLKVAAGHGRIDLVKFFLSRGATYYNSAIEAAIVNGHTETAKFFIMRGGVDSYTTMQLAASWGNFELMILLVKESRLDLDWMMAMATAHGHLGMVKLLISKGATDLGWAAGVAAWSDHREILEYLIETCSVDPDGTPNPTRALQCINRAITNAVNGGRVELTKLLISMGATDINNAMIDAASQGHAELVRLLIDAGANDFTEAAGIALRHRHRELAWYIRGRAVVYHCQRIVTYASEALEYLSVVASSYLC